MTTSGRANIHKPIDEVKRAQPLTEAQVRIGTVVWQAIQEVARRASAMSGERVDPHLVCEGILQTWLMERGHWAEGEGFVDA